MVGRERIPFITVFFFFQASSGGLPPLTPSVSHIRAWGQDATVEYARHQPTAFASHSGLLYSKWLTLRSSVWRRYYHASRASTRSRLNARSENFPCRWIGTGALRVRLFYPVQQ